jgi:hypothetical protein
LFHHPLWATGTVGHGGDVAVMQSDGNFVLYSEPQPAGCPCGYILGAYRYPLWSSHTYTSPNAHLVLQADGNLVIYTPGPLPPRAIWASNTVYSGWINWFLITPYEIWRPYSGPLCGFPWGSDPRRF